MKKLKIILLIVLIILALLVIFTEITRSSILFFLNSKDVDLFKSRFADTFLSGNRTINTIGTDINIPDTITNFSG